MSTRARATDTRTPATMGTMTRGHSSANDMTFLGSGVHQHESTSDAGEHLCELASHEARTTRARASLAIAKGPAVAADSGDHLLPSALVLVVLAAAAAAAADAPLTLALPPLSLVLELVLAINAASVLNAAVALACWLRSFDAWPGVSAALLLALLPVPYLLPARALQHSMPHVTFALLVWIGVWKGLDVAGGTAPTACRGRPSGGSLINLLVWFCFPIEYHVEAGGAPSPAPARALRAAVRTLVLRGLAFAALASFVATAQPVGALRVYAQVWTVHLFLGLNFDASAVGLAALGFRPTTTFRDPLTRATSPSDFWGRRWNLLVHLEITMYLVSRRVLLRTAGTFQRCIASSAARSSGRCARTAAPPRWARPPPLSSLASSTSTPSPRRRLRACRARRMAATSSSSCCRPPSSRPRSCPPRASARCCAAPSAPRRASP
jgi:hypothetical protein